MKSTNEFKKVIKAHLDCVAAKDELFAETLKKPNKNIDECINYILTEVQKSGCNGFADDEIFNMAIHYYDEDDIKNIKPVKSRVVVNQTIELSENEIKEAKQKALDKVVEEEKERLRTKKKVKQEKTPITETPTLF